MHTNQYLQYDPCCKKAPWQKGRHGDRGVGQSRRREHYIKLSPLLKGVSKVDHWQSKTLERPDLKEQRQTARLIRTVTKFLLSPLMWKAFLKQYPGFSKAWLLPRFFFFLSNLESIKFCSASVNIFLCSIIIGCEIFSCSYLPQQRTLE